MKYPTIQSNMKRSSKGFAMLFTIVIISIILSLAMGIADVTYKQTILSSLATNSQLAFFQADAGVECGMYYKLNKAQFDRGTSSPAGVRSTIVCGNTTLQEDMADSATNDFVYTQNNAGTKECFSVEFDNTDPVHDVISSRGYSTCSSTAQQVERGLKVTF